MELKQKLETAHAEFDRAESIARAVYHAELQSGALLSASAFHRVAGAAGDRYHAAVSAALAAVAAAVA